VSTHTVKMHRAAQLYYEEGLTQAAISGILGTSRATVSRLITEARRKGIVRITVHPQINRDAALSEQLRTRFDLRDVIVVPAASGYETAIKNVGAAAA